MDKNHFDKYFGESDSRVKRTFKIIGMVFVGLVFAVCFALVFGFLVKWLWNWLLPDLFALKEITYWQAFGIVILAKLLFGAFGPHHHEKGKGHPRPFGTWHGPFDPFEDGPWRRKSPLRHDYQRYWQEEGKNAFEGYLGRIKKEGTGGAET